MSSMFFMVSVSADGDRLVGAELDHLAELLHGRDLRLRDLPARSFSESSLRAASSAGPWLARLALSACNCRLAASRGMSRPERSTMVPSRWRSTVPAPAEMTMAIAAITAKAETGCP